MAQTVADVVVATLKMNGSRRLVGSFNHGTMANALPHAIGARQAIQAVR